MLEDGNSAVPWCGASALHVACCRGHDGVAKVLLKAGADPDLVQNSMSHEVATPLLLTSYHNHVLIASLLLDYGAAVDGVDGGILPPIIGAVCYRHYEFTCLLLDRGAAIDGRAGEDECDTPLYYAA